MIRITELHKSFGSHKVLKGLNLRVEQGEIYGFIGSNGAGKTTTMNILMGLMGYENGECSIGGVPVSGKKRSLPRNVGYLPEAPGLYPFLTGREYLTMLSRLNPGAKQSGIKPLLESVGLEKAGNRRIGKYSRGMKQRMGMAAILLNDPDLFILDEPSSALDPEGRKAMQGLILDLQSRGKTVFLSTHILDDIERICTRIGLLHNGVIVLDKSMQELENEYLQPIFDVRLITGLNGTRYTALRDAASVLPGVNLLQKSESADSILSFHLDSPENTVPLLRLLTEQKISIRSITQRTKSLEEVILEIGDVE